MCTQCNHLPAERRISRVSHVRPISGKLPKVTDRHFDVPLRNPEFPHIFQGAYHTRKGRNRTEEHALLYKGDIAHVPAGQEVLIRINSACYTGDIFRDQSCDCNWQMFEAMRMLEAWDGPGLVLYHFAHEGKAHGYLHKLRAYDPETGTYPVNGDKRDFTSSIAILKDLGITHIRLMTNNPHKREALEKHGFIITGTVHVVSGDENLKAFLDWKAKTLGHEIDTSGGGSSAVKPAA